MPTHPWKPRSESFPLAVSLTGSNRNDVTQLLPLLDKIPLPDGSCHTRIGSLSLRVIEAKVPGGSLSGRRSRSIAAGRQSSEAVQPGVRSLDDVPEDAQAGAVGLAASGDDRAVRGRPGWDRFGHLRAARTWEESITAPTARPTTIQA
ncbi:hypothetical protein GCM10018780_88270 [Streptomyces lanatus]|nr:hypothetical protein GCM10018780_88270 [Streptomyces lanatus]